MNQRDHLEPVAGHGEAAANGGLVKSCHAGKVNVNVNSPAQKNVYKYLLETVVNWIKIIISCLFPLAAIANSESPRVVACDYKFGNKFTVDICLITGGGIMQARPGQSMGSLWIAFKIKKIEYRFIRNSLNLLEQIDADTNAVLHSYKITNSVSQCRGGSFDVADKYEFSNGDYICLYSSRR